MVEPALANQVTPPGAQTEIIPQSYCDESVPGFWAVGSTDETVSGTEEWFEENFGPIDEEATAFVRSQYEPDASHRVVVYEQIRVGVGVISGRTHIDVLTYDTASHECLSRRQQAWDLRNASVFEDACGELIIDFWGVEYGGPKPKEPPPTWSVMTFSGGQSIAYSIKKPSVIYASTAVNKTWHRYRSDRGCFDG